MNIHLIMPFSRPENKDKLIEAYRPMGVILHPIMFTREHVDFDEENETWIEPTTLRDDIFKPCLMPGCFKRNWFIENREIIDDDYYVTVDDDDFYESNVFDEVRKMDDDIVIISMKRGHRTPKEALPPRDYPTDTLWARPEDVSEGFISAQQSFVKGKIFKAHLHNEEAHVWDGELAVHHKEAGEQIAYRPDLFALFNYYEPGRWDDGPKVTFGAMINDTLRFDQVLKQSQINGTLAYVTNPESATKGLNILLEKAENESADITVLCHQDVFFRSGWVDQLRRQIKLLPENWVCAGVIGKDYKGRVCGKFHDMRIPDHWDTSDIHTFPQPACCFDEAVIIINMKKGFRFDETMDSFDLYGTLCCLQTWESGGTSWIIDCFTEHYCMRSFQWMPNERFIQNYKWLHDKYNSIETRIDSTAIGLPPGETMRFETSAAPEEAAA